MRFDWQNSEDEIKGLRSHNTKDFLHPTELGKRIKIQYGGLLHAYTDKGFEDIEKELPDYSFPEGEELRAPQLKHFIMNLPDWGEVKVEDGGKVVRVFDKKGVSIFRYSNPIVVGKGKAPFKVVKDGKKVRDAFNAREELALDEKIANSEASDECAYEVEDNKLYFKLPPTLKNTYPLQAYDATDTGSTNNKDALIQNNFPDNNCGAYAALQILYSAGTIQRSVMEWTLSAGSGVISKIGVFLKVSGNTDARQNDLHELTQAFVEGTGNNEAVAGVTWNDYNAGAWSSAGGDYSGTVVCHLTPAAVGNWDEYIIQGAGSDNGLSLDWGNTVDFIIKLNAESGVTSASYYRSKEYATEADRPYLEITYTPPGIGAQYINISPFGVTIFGGKTN